VKKPNAHTARRLKTSKARVVSESFAPKVGGAAQQRRGSPQNLLFAFDSARRSPYRTWFWFPWLDPKTMDYQLTREEKLRKKWWLYNNTGVVPCVVNGLAREEVDTGIWPVPRTSSPSFNTAVKEAFTNDCNDARFFDEAAKRTYHGEQLSIRRNIYLMGEKFGQFLQAGQGSNIPTHHPIPSWQVAGAGLAGNQDDTGQNWVDGTLANERGRVFLYRVYDDVATGKYRNVNANDLMHYFDDMWDQQRRGTSCLDSVAMKLFSIDDIERVANVGELLRQRIAYQITKPVGDTDEPTLVPGATVVDTVSLENADGSTTNMHVQRIQSTDGQDIDVADLPPGRKLEMVESSKGGDAIAWNEHVLSEIAMATPYPPSYVFYLSRPTQGTVYRGDQKKVQRAKNVVRHLQLKPQFCARWYSFWLWQCIKASRFDNVEGGVPKDWFVVRWSMPADDSVDTGRDAAVLDDRLDSGKITRSQYRSALGGDPTGEDEEDEIIETRVRALKKIHDRREELRKDPVYAQLADDPQLSYEMIFRESKVGVTVRETNAGTLEEEGQDTPPGTGKRPPLAAPIPGRNGHNGNGAHALR
jgi:capsid protein